MSGLIFPQQPRLIRPTMYRPGEMRPSIIREGLITWYMVNEYREQRLFDLSGQNIHGTLGSAAGSDTNDPSWASGYLRFGGDDYFTAGNPAQLQTSNPFTVGVIVYFSTIGFSCVISKQVGSGASGGTGFYIVSSAGVIALYIYDGTNTRRFCDSARTVATWGLIQAVYNGTQIQIQNGLASSASASLTGYSPAAAQDVTIGKYSYASSAYLPSGSGVAGYFAYNRALSREEREYNYRVLLPELNRRGVILAA